MDVKTCKTCAHYRKGVLSSLPQCAAAVDPVDGGPGAFCDIERDGPGLRTGCGRAGRRWEPRPPAWWQFWKRSK